MTWKYFTKDEFACNCGCGRNEIDEDFVSKLNNARGLAGVPFRITSGYRCPIKNMAVGGVSNSAHLKGLAADIYCDNGNDRYHIIKALLATRFGRIEMGHDWIHVDEDMSKPHPTIFYPGD